MCARFSERVGKRIPKESLQLDSIDADLRNSLWNVLDAFIFEPLKDEEGQAMKYSQYYSICFHIWYSFLKTPIDQMPWSKDGVAAYLRAYFFKIDYLDVFDFIDFLLQNELPFRKDKFIQTLNFILEREMSGYRIVNNQLTPITNEMEIKTIESAIESSKGKFSGAKIHLEEALNKLSDKKTPDYRNSIKESISAVENVCKILSNKKSAVLTDALNELKKHIAIHPALEQGFIKLYNYTSDAHGIRHALMAETNLNQEDALFMLVTASAFVNYLISKSAKISS